MKYIQIISIFFFVILFTVSNIAKAAVVGSLTGGPVIYTSAVSGDITISHDGTSVYTVSGVLNAENSLSGFTRNVSTGALSSEVIYGSIGRNVNVVAISPDGTSVYVSGDTKITKYTRGSDGSLYNKVIYPFGGQITSIDISPDNSSVYLTWIGGGVGFSGYVSRFIRNVSDGTLSGELDYLVDGARRPYKMAVSPDGKSVYVSNDTGTNAVIDNGRLCKFNRASNGTLSSEVCYVSPMQNNAAAYVAISPDGTSVYVSGYIPAIYAGGLYPTTPAKAIVAMYHRDTSTGNLSTKTEYVSGSQVNDSANGVVVSPDGLSVYVANMTNGGIRMFSRAMDGTLVSGGTYSSGWGPVTMTISADGTWLYVANTTYKYIWSSQRTVAPITGTVTVSSNISSASWRIDGPGGLIINGSGTSQTLTSQPVGLYTITYNAVTGYTTPATQTLTLLSAGTIPFNGTYGILNPTVKIQFSYLDKIISTLSEIFSV